MLLHVALLWNLSQFSPTEFVLCEKGEKSLLLQNCLKCLQAVLLGKCCRLEEFQPRISTMLVANSQYLVLTTVQAWLGDKAVKNHSR